MFLWFVGAGIQKEDLIFLNFRRESSLASFLVVWKSERHHGQHDSPRFPETILLKQRSVSEALRACEEEEGPCWGALFESRDVVLARGWQGVAAIPNHNRDPFEAVPRFLSKHIS